MDKSLDNYYEFNEVSKLYIKKGKLTEIQILTLKELIMLILEHPQWNKIKNYSHHNKDNRGIHIMKVCFESYKIGLKTKKCEIRKIVIAAMLHDFFDYDWTISAEKKKKLREKHGFTHPKVSLDEAIKHFPLLVDEKVRDAILSHMWPLSKTPKYKESWIVKWSDFKTSMEIIKNPKDLLKYIGLKKKKSKF